MALHTQSSDPILLGSGELYACLSSELTNPENFTTADESKLINIGAIDGDASIQISTQAVDVRSANRKFIKRYAIDKTVNFSTGVMTWVMDNISKFLTGSTFTEDGTTGQKKMVVNANDELPEVYLSFRHNKEDGGQLIVNIYKAQFDGDLSFVFNAENATTTNYQFIGNPTSNLNYVEFIETFPVVTP